MKIGIFGDSYCDSKYTPAYPGWWQLLQQYSHDITCFGESSSSVLFSAKKIIEYGDKFDFIIWTVTTPFRISTEINNEYYHFTNSNEHLDIDSAYFKHAQAARDYLHYLVNINEQVLVSKALVNYVESKFSNLMTIACFPDPLKVDFNLYNLCSWEAECYFPGKQLHELYKEISDIRTCHLSIDNNKILAKLVAENLRPGTFVTDYSNFTKPKEPLEYYFKRK